MYNGHADVTALLDATTGTTRATYYYDAFGNIQEQKYYSASGIETTTPINNSIMYAGYQYDKETGLYYLNARMYDPKIARFLQEDTYAGTINDPLSLNLYTYCTNDPLNYYDPTGHDEMRLSFHLYLQNAQVPIAELAQNVKGASVSVSKGSRTTTVVYKGKIITYDSSYRTNLDGFYWDFGDVDSVKDTSPIIEAYDLLDVYGAIASGYSRLQNDEMYRNMLMPFQIADSEKQYLQELSALRELLLENRAIQSNEDVFLSIYNSYVFDKSHADKLSKVIRSSNKRFDRVISDELTRRDIELAKGAGSFFLDSIDVIGDIKGGAETIFGYNFIQQEKLSTTDRVITGATTAAPFVFGAIAKRIRPLLNSIDAADGIAWKLTNKLMQRANAGVGNGTRGLSIATDTVENTANQMVKLNGRQKQLLNMLPEYGSEAIVSKRGVKLNDLVALTNSERAEFAMFTRGNQRLVIRGGSKTVPVNPDRAMELANSGWKWSGHTHPGITVESLKASAGDRAVLEAFQAWGIQNKSVVKTMTGEYKTFTPDFFADMFGY